MLCSMPKKALLPYHRLEFIFSKRIFLATSLPPPFLLPFAKLEMNDQLHLSLADAVTEIPFVAFSLIRFSSSKHPPFLLWTSHAKRVWVVGQPAGRNSTKNSLYLAHHAINSCLRNVKIIPGFQREEKRCLVIHLSCL